MAIIMHRARNRGVIGVKGSQGTWFSQGPAINAGSITPPTPFVEKTDKKAKTPK